MKQMKILLMLVLVILFQCSKEGKSNNKTMPTPTSSGVTVDVDIARKGTLYEYIQAGAMMAACQKGEITSLISAPVLEIKIRDGSQVQKGDELVLLDQRNIWNELVTSRSDYIKALSELVLELEISGHEELLKQWQEYQIKVAENQYSIPRYPTPQSGKMMVMLSRLNIQTNYNRVREYEYQLENCRIKAPFSGVVSGLTAFVGAYVRTGEKICNLTDLSQMQVKVEILEEDLKDIEPGTTLYLLNDTSRTTTVEAILPTIDEQKYSGIAIAYIDNSNHIYKDGQHVQVRIEKNVYNERLYIRRSALLNRNDRDLIFVVKAGIAKWCYVDVGFGNNDFLEITKGIEAGDTVIVGGHYSLAHNVRVKY